MQYPLISEYISSILNAEDNFKTMTDLRPVLNDDGNPVMSSGNFAVVFKMKDIQDGKLYAVKCFTRGQKERTENYRMIAEELGKVSSPYITPIKWLDSELFVNTMQTDETEFPILLMDWIEGPTLSAFLQSIADQLNAGKIFKDNEYEMFELRCLPANFLRMASWLLKQPFAHGDLKPDNIIVQEDGYCVLVDYDGMYVPAMQGTPKDYLGTPNFTHPSQTRHTPDKDIDSYAITIIALSLQVFAQKPNMIAENSDFCVINRQQALRLHELPILRDVELMANNNIQELISLFLHTLSQNKLDADYFGQTIAEILVPKDFDIYNTEVENDELDNCYTDKYRLRYSLDGRRLIGNRDFHTGPCYRIREGVLSICSGALQPKKLPSTELNRVFLPDSVLSIGSIAFANNDDLTSCNIPKSVIHINDNNPWGGCFNIKQMSCNSTHFIIKDGILYSADYKIIYGIIYFHSDLIIDKRAKIIATNAFWSGRDNCKNIIKTITSNNIEEIGTRAFYSCESIENANFSSVKKIGEEAFKGCKKLQNIAIPDSVTNIEEGTFTDCESLQSIQLPSHLSTIGKDAFSGCKSLQSITIPNSVTAIGDRAFSGCDSLQSIQLPSHLSTIGKEAFKGCKKLQNIAIPDSVTNIEEGTFTDCMSLQSIQLPSHLSTIGKSAFFFCSLQSITIPDSVTTIGEWALYCFNLTNINVNAQNKHYSSLDGILFNKDRTELIAFPSGKQKSSFDIPSTVTIIGDRAFISCKSLQSITIPNSVTAIGYKAFSGCASLQSITIPDSVTAIGDGAFSICKSLQSITIPNSVTAIGDRAFSGCDSLQSITIPNSVTAIGDRAFSGCDSLQSITIPDSVTAIGKDAFSVCKSLKNIYVPHRDIDRFKGMLPNHIELITINL